MDRRANRPFSVGKGRVGDGGGGDVTAKLTAKTAAAVAARRQF